MTTNSPIGRRLIRYLAGSALALVLALGSAATASALPEWDIGAYDSCTSRIPDQVPPEHATDYMHECCVKSGGVWAADLLGGKCTAPPAEQSSRNPLTGAPTHVLQPSLLPGPPGDIGQAPGGVLAPSQ